VLSVGCLSFPAAIRGTRRSKVFMQVVSSYMPAGIFSFTFIFGVLLLLVT